MLRRTNHRDDGTILVGIETRPYDLALCQAALLGNTRTAKALIKQGASLDGALRLAEFTRNAQLVQAIGRLDKQVRGASRIPRRGASWGNRNLKKVPHASFRSWPKLVLE